MMFCKTPLTVEYTLYWSIAFTLPDEIQEKEDLAMQIILHTKFVDKVIIGGEFV